MMIDDVIYQMSSTGQGGLSAAETNLDGKNHLFPPESEPNKQKKRAFYFLFEFYTSSGQRLIFGDDDHGKPVNTGRNCTLAAARSVGGIAIFPPIKEGA
jgi:hypothetical protein